MARISQKQFKIEFWIDNFSDLFRRVDFDNISFFRNAHVCRMNKSLFYCFFHAWCSAICDFFIKCRLLDLFMQYIKCWLNFRRQLSKSYISNVFSWCIMTLIFNARRKKKYSCNIKISKSKTSCTMTSQMYSLIKSKFLNWTSIFREFL